MNIEASLQKSLLAIPSINGARLLERMLPTLQIPGDLVVVLDQGSSDDTVDICRKAGVGLRQLGSPHTYTQACNIGAEIARERNCDFVFVANNDITFTTDVMRELLVELLGDPHLGIVAPSQVIIDPVTAVRKTAYRVYWDLDKLTFLHDFEPPLGQTHRLEADFCELTMVAIPMSAISKVGFLDDDYGFYHEDADFGFRLRDAGYTCAYLPNSQIEHWTSSTFSAQPSERKAQFLAKNKRLFARKFLGRYLSHQDHKSNETSSWNIVNKNLHPYLKKYGLVHQQAQELVFTHPGTAPFDYLYTVWETSRPPELWLAFKDRYKMTLTTSHWGVDVLREAGFQRVHYAPLGVESDVFQPWGAAERFADGKTFLWFSRNQHRKGLDILLKAWRPFHLAQPTARLILMGVGILDSMPAPDSIRVARHSRIAEYRGTGITVYETIAAMDEETLASIYRSVDFTVCSSRSEGFGFSVAESMACGTPSIFGDFSSTRDFLIPGSLIFAGTPTKADYSDKAFADVGHWWEPSVEALTACLFDAAAMDDHAYKTLAISGVKRIRTHFSWRESAMSIRRALIAEDLGRIGDANPANGNVQLQRGTPPRLADHHVNPVDTAGIHLNDVVIRGLRRTVKLGTFFADHLEQGGWKRAVRSASSQLIRPYVKNRLIGLKRRLRRGVRRTMALAPVHMPGPKLAADHELRHGVLFIGYAEGALGLGQAFRANMHAADQASLPFAIYPYDGGLGDRRIGSFMPHRYEKNAPYEINVINVTVDYVPEVFKTLGSRLSKGSYNVLCTYWELPKAPEEWRHKLTYVDEIWAPNTYIAKAFANIFDRRINIIPPAIEGMNGEYPGRSAFGMDEGRFYFMFSFDYHSSPHRKNPLGVLRAFQRAFPEKSENVGLVIKSTGAPDQYAEIDAEIANAVKKDSRIMRVDRNMSRVEMLGLIKASDAYVSLHRAEGFGLGMAEAMMLGRVVIGTDFSGCTDFLTAETGYPVPYRLRSLLPHEYPWSAGQFWAEPDQDAAATIMREVKANPAKNQLVISKARDYVTNTYGLPAVGAAMSERISAIFAKRGTSDATEV